MLTGTRILQTFWNWKVVSCVAFGCECLEIIHIEYNFCILNGDCDFMKVERVMLII